MLINELSQKTGFSKDTIRFYEKEGLLDKTISTRSENNYRNYTDEAVERLDFIKQAKTFGFTLKEIKTIIAEWNSVSSEEAIEFMQNKIKNIEEKINKLQTFKIYLLEKKARIEAKINK
ncbi:MAG: MerR family transcriptional regulator [Cyanobacteria bacterium J06643_5]